MKRPQNLPDFGQPPLDEVVLGVQFSPIPGYSAIDARAIWDLYRTEFPGLEEQPMLPPVFETFGGAAPGFHFQFGPFSSQSRLWFVSTDGNHLLQFQPDRFLLNWRKNMGEGVYPRYERISAAFEEELTKLARHLLNEKDWALDINQVEISYINIIPVSEFSEVKNWISLWNPPDFEIEGINMNFPEVVSDQNGQPIARLHHELISAVSRDGSGKVLKLSLTYRGKPEGQGVAEAMKFMAEGRTAIVERFATITTKEAHRAWKRSV